MISIRKAVRSLDRVIGRLLIVFLFGGIAARGESFDKPLRTRVLDLGRSQHLMPYDKRHVTVTCWYYARFMVKEENDPGMKGAMHIALVPVHPGYLPRCTQAQQPHERPFNEWSGEFKTSMSWNGYFAGVKRNLVFLERPDADENVGIPFAAFESDAQTKVFEDSVALREGGRREIGFVSAPGSQIILRYLRVASASCSIPKSGEPCWSKLKQQTGLTNAPLPMCSDYKGEEAGTAASVIAYLVEVSLFPKPSIRPLGSPISCYPTE